MNHKLHRTTGRLVRGELRALLDDGAIRDARVRVDRVARCTRCRISSHMTDGAPVVVEATGATRARAVRVAVGRLKERVRDSARSDHMSGSERRDEHHAHASACTSESFRGAAMDHAFAKSRGAGSSVDVRPNPSAPASRTRVVLLLDESTASLVTVRRASRISNALEATLHVVLGVQGKHGRASAIASYVANLLAAHTPTTRYELEITGKSLVEEGAEIARSAAAAVIIVGASLGGTTACRLADRAGTPVLVARDERPDGELIAASDMRQLRFPVLELARDYAHALERPVLYFHNARPAPMLVADPMAGAAAYVGMLKLDDDAVEAKRARLRNVASADRSANSVVVRAASTVDAMLELARQRDADVLVVGHRRRSWPWRVIGRSTTERVVERSRRSVLIVPLACGA